MQNAIHVKMPKGRSSKIQELQRVFAILRRRDGKGTRIDVILTNEEEMDGRERNEKKSGEPHGSAAWMDSEEKGP